MTSSCRPHRCRRSAGRGPCRRASTMATSLGGSVKGSFVQPSCAGDQEKTALLLVVADDQLADCRRRRGRAGGRRGPCRPRLVQTGLPSDSRPVERCRGPSHPCAVPSKCQTPAIAVVAQQERRVAVRLQYAEADAGIRRRRSSSSSISEAGKSLTSHFAVLRRPEARLPDPVVADDHVHEAVVVHVEQADAVVLAVGGAQRLAAEQVACSAAPATSRKVRNLTFLPCFVDRMVDQLDDLLVANPAVRVEDEAEDALLDDGGVEGGLPVARR